MPMVMIESRITATGDLTFPTGPWAAASEGGVGAGCVMIVPPTACAMRVTIALRNGVTGQLTHHPIKAPDSVAQTGGVYRCESPAVSGGQRNASSSAWDGDSQPKAAICVLD